jgi:hypothetical protein
MRLPYIRTHFLPPLLALGLASCLSDSEKADPYAGLSCDAKIAAMTREVLEFQASQTPAAKASARLADSAQTDSTKTGSAQSDTTQADTARVPIQIFRGYPPVANPGDPVSGPGMKDARDPIIIENPDSQSGVQWIPPMGFDSLTGTLGTLPVTQDSLVDSTRLSALPNSVSVLQIVTTMAYKAHVRIQDYKGDWVREFDQDFGYQGEFKNPQRIVPSGGRVSFLVWNGKDVAGREVPTGVYRWHVTTVLENNQIQERSAKIAYLAQDCRE